MKNKIIVFGAILTFFCLNAQSSLHFQTLFEATKDKDIQCYRIPSMVTAPNGDLIVAIDQRVPNCGDLKYNNNINIVIRRSKDNGKTWLPIEKVVDFPLGQSASDPSMIVDKKSGKIFMFYNYMDLENHKGIFKFHLVTSTDNGKTWSAFKDITSQIAPKEWEKDFKFITSGRGIKASNGRLMHTLVNLQHGGFVFSSEDHGTTWQRFHNKVGNIDESKIIELANGELMVNARVNKKGSRGVFKTSPSIGKWQEFVNAQSLPDPSCNASIIRYTSTKDGFKKNRLLFVNPKSTQNRENLTVRISYDEGNTWSEGKTIYSGSAAYATLTILSNGDIGVCFEKDDYTKNVFTSFSLSWLTNGKDFLKKSYQCE